METVLAVVLTSILAPLILLVATSQITSRTKREDWARQDAVAKAAADAADRLADSQERLAEVAQQAVVTAEQRAKATAAQAAEAAALLVRSNASVAAATTVTNGKLDVIHTLVNSNMTSAMESELDARRVAVALMHELVDIKKAASQSPSGSALAAIEVGEAKISALEKQLEERRVQQEAADKLVPEPGALTALQIHAVEENTAANEANTEALRDSTPPP